MIALKTRSELTVMRENGQTLAAILAEVCRQAVPGKSTAFLDEMAEDLLRQAGAKPAFKGYRGYPATICASLNEEVVHGIPTRTRILREGDILSVDIGLLRDGLYSDTAMTVAVGEIDEQTRHLLQVTEASLWCGIEQVTLGNRLSDISHAIGSYIEREGLHVVKEYVGHGIGRDLHEDPQIPNYGPPGNGPRLQAGMVFAIEPMVKNDPDPTMVLDDGWTVVTASGGVAAHFEHTVAITEAGIDVLTRGGEVRRSG
ncbi:type I methionyl aminopeptidase [Candidatus Bipolaricaulota bacterium]|nr:type I methionyl aminopeptidase [Candidatus Bipolaricaulota bacterium]